MSLSVNITQRLGAFDLAASFEAPKGVTVLFGPSGSGKTSVIKAVAGLNRPDAGRIAVEGEVLFDGPTNLPPHKRRLGYVFQDARLFPHLNVAKNLDYGARFAPALPPAQRDRVIEMLGLGHLLTRRPVTLSGGEQQRVAIGRALLSNPRMILADEPLAALDAERKAEILPYFEELRDAFDIPILYVSHSAAEVARLATTIVVMEEGRVRRRGPAMDILSDPEVTPLGVEAAGAMIEAVVIAHHNDGLSELAAGDARLFVGKVPCDPGQKLRVHIAAQDVMLARTKPTGISALNVIPVTLTELRHGEGSGALVKLDAGGPNLLARITQRSVSALDLAPGQQMYAVIKAVSVPREALGKIR